jgi:AhpD family alkylhydroperoxidase
VPQDQRDVFDEMVKSLGSVPRHGPGSVMIHVPKAHRWATGLNHYLRDESSLPKKIQELAMLVTARELDCQHIWNAHAASARKAGVRNEPRILPDPSRQPRRVPVGAGAVRPPGRRRAGPDPGQLQPPGAADQLVRHRLARREDRAASARLSAAAYTFGLIANGAVRIFS